MQNVPSNTQLNTGRFLTHPGKTIIIIIIIVIVYYATQAAHSYIHKTVKP